MKTNYLPAIIMLCAGFVDCLMAIKNHLSLKDFTIELLIVLVVFYVAGVIAKTVLDHAFPVEESEENPDDAEEDKNADEEAAESQETVEEQAAEKLE